MIRYAVTLFATLAIFVALDFAWISLFAGSLYRETLGVTMAEHIRIAPAFLFYPLYVVGIMIFVVPREEGWQTLGQTFMFGAFYGLFTYGTFSLTNLAMITAWTPSLAVTDIAWGTIATGVAVTIGSLIGDWIMTNVFMA